MFLDEKLLSLCKNTDLTDAVSIQDLNNRLCRECEDYYKSRLTITMSKKEAKAVLDRTFNLWDSFIRLTEKDEDDIKILGQLLKEYSFKSQFLANPKVKQVYNSL